MSTYARVYPSGLICAFTIFSEVETSAQVASAALSTRKAAVDADDPSWKAFVVIARRRRGKKEFGERRGMGNGRGKAGWVRHKIFML